jgi:hypothetical protein
MTSRAPSTRAGFSVFELLVVVALIGAVAALVGVRLVPPARLADPPLLGVLQAARTAALQQGRPSEVVVEGSGLQAPSAAVSFTPPTGTRLRRPPATDALAAGTIVVRFFPDGTATHTRLVLEQATPPHRSLLEVKVDPFTGRIRIVERNYG